MQGKNKKNNKKRVSLGQVFVDQRVSISNVSRDFLLDPKPGEG